MPFNSSSILPHAAFETGVEDIWDSVGNKYVYFGIAFSILLICLLGLAGNILSGIIFTRPKHNSSIDCILLALALADSVFLLSVFLADVARWTLLLSGWTFGLLVNWFEVCFPYLYYLAGAGKNFNLFAIYFCIHILSSRLKLIANTNTFLLISALSWERFVAVCLPLKARHICTWRKARIYVITISCFSLFLNWPRLFVIEVPVHNQGYTLLEFSRVTMDHVLILVNILFPLTSLLYCHTKIFVQVL